MFGGLGWGKNLVAVLGLVARFRGILICGGILQC